MAESQYRKRMPRVGWSCQHPGSGSASCGHAYLTVRKHWSIPITFLQETQGSEAGANLQSE